MSHRDSDMRSGHDDEVLARWRRAARRALPGADIDLVEEVAQYVADRWTAARQQGASDRDADAQAAADLDEWIGHPLPEHRSVRARTAAWMGLGADLRTAVRSLRVNPLFTVGAALLSAIAVTGIVSGVALIYGILWRPLPYPEPDRLAVVWQVREGEETQVSYADFTDVAAAPVFDGRSAIAGGRGSLRIGDAIERINALELEPSGLSLLGARPYLGRLLAAPDRGQPVCLISHRLWTSRLAADPNVVGRMLWLSGRQYEVVGVLQPGFDFELPVPPSFVLENNDVWMLLDTTVPFAARRDFSGYEGLVRLAPGRTLDEAQAAADAVAARLAREHPGTNAGRRFRIAPLAGEVTAGVRRPLLLVALGCLVLLLVAAANLAILGLLRGADRQSEFAIREALGAGVWRLRRQIFVENLLIACCGTVAGVQFARGIVRMLAGSEAAQLPRTDALLFDAASWIAAAAVTIFVAAALSIQPMADRSTSLRSGGRSAGPTVRRSRRVMVAVEVALALTLSTAGGFLALSVVRLLAVDPGFDAARTAAARVSAYQARYPDREAVVRLFDDVLSTLNAMPQVARAGAGSSLPLSGQASGTSVIAQGRPVDPAARLTAGWQFITPGYVDASSMRLHAGREFTEADRRRDPHVTIINADLARILFGEENPLGRRIAVGGGDTAGDWHEIVGVVADVRHESLDSAPSPRVYDLFGQHWGRTLYVVARSSTSDARGLPDLIRRVVAGEDPEAPVFELATMDALVQRSVATRRLASIVAVGLAASGVLLALLGVYAVMAASVAERTREIGVRAALGASRQDLFRLIWGEGWRTVAWGAAGGVAASAAVARILQSQLFGVRESDAVWLIALVTIGLAGAAAVAAIPPGRRAASVDPLEAMRAE
jgi:putative ABC transport system permease protein